MKTLLDYYQLHPTSIRVVHPGYEEVPMSTEHIISISDNIELLYETFGQSDDYPDTHQLCIDGHHTQIYIGDIHELELLITFLSPPDADIMSHIHADEAPFVKPPTMHLQLLGPAQPEQEYISVAVYDTPLSYN